MPVNRTRRVSATGLELRKSGDTVSVEGYASTFNQPYDMGWYQETVSPGAFTKTLSERPDVRFLVNHTDLPLARTRSKTLDLSQDSTGLYMRAQLDANDPDVQRIVPKMERGDLDQMSFAFGIVRQEWDEDYENRWLNELSLADGDVSIVTYPANPNTSVGLRSRLSAEHLDAVRIRAAYRALREEREGKTISAATQRELEAVLETLDQIDDATDEAVETIQQLINPPAADAGSAEEEQDDARTAAGHPARRLAIEIENFLSGIR